MSKENAPDWLPAGWTVNRTVRKNGKKDVCYIDPLNDLKFYSKPEVLRHLKKEQEKEQVKEQEKEQEISCQKSNKKKSTSKHVENVLVEKTVPEELPPGWIKELKVKKRGRRIRKDSYYTDPVTGYIFRSLKDVNRYLKTGVVGKHAFKLKDDNRVDMELNDEKINTDTAAEREKSSDEGTNGQITVYQSSKLVETGNDEPTLELTDAANAVCISGNASETRKENVAVGDVNIPEASGSDAREKKTENELKEKAIQDKKKKSGEKSNPSLPRRASKRLATVEFDLSREPKTRRQAAARRASEVITSSICLASSVESETKATANKSPNEKQLNSAVLPHVKNFETDNKSKERHDGNAEEDKKANEKQQLPIVLTPGSHATSKELGRNVGPEERNGEVETNKMPMEGQDPPNQFPTVNITTSEEHSKLVMDKMLNKKLELPNELPLGSLSTSAEDHGKKVELDNKDNSCEKPDMSNIFPPADLSPANNLSLTNLWADPCIDFAVKTLTGAIPVGEESKVDTYSESPLDLPLGGLWTDPCIDFAVKTLTGAIPVGEDLNVQEYFQQQACSSENQGLNGPTLPDVGATNFSQNNFVSLHFNTAENSVHKQQEFGVPVLPNHINGSLQLPSGIDLNQHVKGNDGECSRQTFFK